MCLGVDGLGWIPGTIKFTISENLADVNLHIHICEKTVFCEANRCFTEAHICQLVETQSVGGIKMMI